MRLSNSQFWLIFIGVNELAPLQFCLILGIAIKYLFILLRVIIVKILFFKIKLGLFAKSKLRKKPKQFGKSNSEKALGKSKQCFAMSSLRIAFNLFLLTINYITAKLVEVKNLMWKHLTVYSSLIHKASKRLNAKDIQWLVKPSGFISDKEICRGVMNKAKLFSSPPLAKQALAKQALASLALYKKFLLSQKQRDFSTSTPFRVLGQKTTTLKVLGQKTTTLSAAACFASPKDLYWFVGFTDGDGCLSVYKEKKYPSNWRHEFTIGLEIADIRLLHQIKSFLACGTVRKYNNVAIFRIKKVHHILYILIPIFDKYPLLTEKKRDSYLNFRNTFLSKVLNSKRASIDDKNYCEYLLKNTPDNLYKLPINDLLSNLRGEHEEHEEEQPYYFDNWIVGFTEAEGSFYFVKDKAHPPNNSQCNLRAEFRISQNDNRLLLNQIRNRLNLKREVALATNSKNHYYIIARSIQTIQNVIKFLSNHPSKLVKLKGKKYLNFKLWLKGIKSIPRYKNIKI